MNLVKYIIINVVETLLRFVPMPCKTGLVKIGNPGRNSPVFLTCNFHLTVARVKRALRGIDCYLLVTNSGGDNVWCGATGGHLTNHEVVSVVKTSGIEDLVDHRDLVLPQLAATGIETKIVQKKTGWRVIWGPVYAKDIPAFVRSEFRKTEEMRQVSFPAIQRFEMAVMWAFPFMIIAAAVVAPFNTRLILPVSALIWILPLLIFLAFPLYSGMLPGNRAGGAASKFRTVLDFVGVPLVLWLVFLLMLAAFGIFTGSFTLSFMVGWGVLSLAIIALITLDLKGTTPIYKSGFQADRFLKVVLDKNKCTGAGFCEQVCPTNCFEVDKEGHTATIPSGEKCVQCGACIVQCPFDALQFESPHGDIVNPETVRTYKLNLLGSRLLKVGGGEGGGDPFIEVNR